MRGFKWSFNYRGFDVFCKAGPMAWKVVPTQNMIDKGMATAENTIVTNDGQYVFEFVDSVVDAE